MTTLLEPSRRAAAASPVMRLLADGVPLTLLLDLLAADPPGPDVLAAER